MYRRTVLRYMANANCQNGSCGHTWTLQKAPGEYKDGVRCPSCGSTDVDIKTGGQGGAPATQQQAGQQGQVQAQPAQGQQQQPGATTSALALMDDNVGMQQKAQAAQGLFGAVGNIAEQFFQFQQQKQQAMEERAKNVELEESDLPACNNEVEEEVCGYQFGPEDIGLGTNRVRCPMCGAVYDIEGPA